MTHKHPIVGPESLGFRADLSSRIDAYLQRKFIKKGLFAGSVTLVARHGEIASITTSGSPEMGGSDPMRDDHLFRIYSMTKPITSVALMMLYEEGYFNLEDAVGKYLPEFANPRVRTGGSYPMYLTRPATTTMTIASLLSHTSGLTYDFLMNSNIDYGYRKNGLSGARAQMSLEEFSQGVAKMPLEFDPGTRWNYSVGTDIIGRLIEVLSGQSFESFLQERIFTPLKMTDTSFQVPADKLDRLTHCYENPLIAPVKIQDDPANSTYANPAKCAMGGSGLVSTVWDYFRFSQMLANQGEFEGTRYLGAPTVELMTSNHLPGDADLTSFGVPGVFSESPMTGSGFGLGFSMVIDPAANLSNSRYGEFGWGGAATTNFWISPMDGVVGIFMTQLMPSGTTSVRRGIHAVIHGALGPDEDCCG